MKVYGYVVVIKRSGGDYTSYPLTAKRCIIGRNSDCDIRVQLPSVSKLHCKIEVDDAGKAYITNLNSNNSTLLNNVKIPSEQPIDLFHNDDIIIADRKFRWEYSYPNMCKTENSTLQQNISQISPSVNAKNAIDNYKRVSFGPYLSPEQFDLKLPPSTPVRKGEKPYDGDDDTTHRSSKKSRPQLPSLLLPVAENYFTPPKSLLKRRSPTPIKPSLAKSLGIFPKKSPKNDERNSPRLTKDRRSSGSPSNYGTKKRKRSQSPVNPSKRRKQSETPLKGKQTPKDLKSPKSVKKSMKKSRSFADVVKSSRGNNPAATLSKPISPYKVIKTRKTKKSKSLDDLNMEVKKSYNFGINSTGHANSPAPIIIHKKVAKTPKIYRKGKKILMENKKHSPNLEGIDILFKSPISPLSKPPKEKLKRKSLILPSELLRKTRNSKSPISLSWKSLTNKKADSSKVLKSSKSETSLNAISKPSSSKYGSQKISKSYSFETLNKSPRILSSPGKLNISTRLSESYAAKSAKISSPENLEKNLRRLSKNNSVVSPRITKLTRLSQSPKRLSRSSNTPKSPGKSETPKTRANSLSNTPKSPNASRKSKSPKRLSKSPKVVKSPRASVSPKTSASSPRNTPSFAYKASRTSQSPKRLSKSKEAKSLSESLSEKKIAGSPTTPLNYSKPSRISQPPKRLSELAELYGNPVSPKAAAKSSEITPSKLQSLKIQSKSPRGSLSPKASSKFLKTSPYLRLSSASKLSQSPKLSTRSSSTTKRLSRSSTKSPNITPKRKSKSPKASTKSPSITPKRKSKSPKASTKKLSITPKRKSISPKASTKSPRITPNRKSKSPEASTKSPSSTKRLSESQSTTPKRISTSPKASTKSPRTTQDLRASIISQSKSLSKSPKVGKSPRESVSSKASTISPRTTISKRLSKSPRKSVSSKSLTVTSKINTTMISQSPLKLSKSSRTPSSKFSVSPRVSQPLTRLSKSPKESVSPKSPRTISRVSNTPKKMSKILSLTKSTKESPSPRVTPSSFSKSLNVSKSFDELSKSPRKGISPQITTTNSKVSESSRVSQSKEFSKSPKVANSPRASVSLKTSPSSFSKLPRTSQSFKRVSPRTVSSLRLSKASQSNILKTSKYESEHSLSNPRSRRSMKISDTSASNKLYTPRKAKSLGKYNFPRNEDSFLKSFNSELKGSLGKSKTKQFSKSKMSEDFTSPNASLSYIFSMSSSSTPSPATPPSGRKSRASMRNSNIVTPFTSASKLTSSVKSTKLKRLTVNSSTIGSINDFSTVGTPDITMDRFISPVESATPTRMYPESISRLHYLSAKELLNIPVDSDCTTYEFNSHETPNISKEKFVSPIASAQRLAATSSSLKQTPLKDCNMTKSIQKLFSNEQSPDLSEIRKLFENSNFGSTTIENTSTTDKQNVSENKKLLRNPRAHSSPVANYSDFAGLKKLMRTPQKGPTCDFTNVHGLKKLLRTPQTQKKTPQADYTTVHGIKRLMKTPRVKKGSPKADYTNVTGLKRLLNPQKEKEDCQPNSIYNLEGLRELMKSPKYQALSQEADEIRLLRSEKMSNMPDLGDLKLLFSTSSTPFNSPDNTSANLNKTRSNLIQAEEKNKKYSKSPYSSTPNVQITDLKYTPGKRIGKEISDDDLTPRRKRGRPTKNKSPKIPDSDSRLTVANENVNVNFMITSSPSTVIQESSVEGTPISRPRGRPKKVSSATKSVEKSDIKLIAESSVGSTPKSISKDRGTTKLDITPSSRGRRRSPKQEIGKTKTKFKESKPSPSKSLEKIYQKLDMESTPNTANKSGRALRTSTKKVVQELDSNSTPNTRRRGRPPTKSTPLHEKSGKFSDSPAENKASCHSRIAVMKKLVLESDTEEKQVEESEPQKITEKSPLLKKSLRRRGRPAHSDSVDQEFDNKLTPQTMSQKKVLVESVEEPVPARKRRGRPAKHISPKTVEQQSETKPSSEKSSVEHHKNVSTTEKFVLELDAKVTPVRKGRGRAKQLSTDETLSSSPKVSKASDIKSPSKKSNRGKQNASVSPSEKVKRESEVKESPVRRLRGRGKRVLSTEKTSSSSPKLKKDSDNKVSPVTTKSQDTSSNQKRKREESLDAKSSKRKLEINEENSSSQISPRKTRTLRTRAAAANPKKSVVKSSVKRAARKPTSKNKVAKESEAEEEEESKTSVKRTTRASKKATPVVKKSPGKPKTTKATKKEVESEMKTTPKAKIETRKTRAKKVSSPVAEITTKRVTRARAKK